MIDSLSVRTVHMSAPPLPLLLPVLRTPETRHKFATYNKYILSIGWMDCSGQDETAPETDVYAELMEPHPLNVVSMTRQCQQLMCTQRQRVPATHVGVVSRTRQRPQLMCTASHVLYVGRDGAHADVCAEAVREPATRVTCMIALTYHDCFSLRSEL